MRLLEKIGTFGRRPMVWMGLLLLLMGLLMAARLPVPLFDTPYSTVLEDRDGRLLGALIAEDGQWRFPASDSLPYRFQRALLQFEDRRFFRHPGVDWRALARASWQNMRAGRVVSGGSTISMQVVRLARGNPPRTLLRKGLEILQALHLEFRYSKEAILALYATHAPFGGNVVGLESAAWRYFEKAPHRLSWSECATLAVLPNQPGLIHPGRHRDRLRRKRDRLLDRLLAAGALDSLSWSLARAEPLVAAPHPLPQYAPHLLQRARREAPDAPRLRSTLQADLQKQVIARVDRHHRRLAGQGIDNLAALILEVETGEALAYVGNAQEAAEAAKVDLITARRSTGSILKPFLYAGALHEGLILPGSLLRDIPQAFDQFQPQNFHPQHDGLVPADRALQRSLNVPMVFLLRDYGLEKFHVDLQRLGLQTIDRPPGHYGLSLILGGAEASLWDLAGAYASMARVLRRHYEAYGTYDPADWHAATFVAAEPGAEIDPASRRPEATRLDAASIWHTFQTMEQLERPGEEGRWQQFPSSRRLAWKTGTSYGFRDAWAIGLDARFVIAVWAGNADGEGRPGLVGVRAAAPLLFDLVDLLPRSRWFEPPLDELVPVTVCRASGYRALPFCPADTLRVGRRGLRARACPYHRRVHLSADGSWRVNLSCAERGLQTVSRLVLPPREEFFYRQRHPEYAPLPPFHPHCPPMAKEADKQPMAFIFPDRPTRTLIPTRLDGTPSSLVFQLAHRHPETTVYWHVDETYLGSTRGHHQMPFRASPGTYRLVVTDAEGHRLEEQITLLAHPEGR